MSVCLLYFLSLKSSWATGPERSEGPLAHLVERLICNEEVTGSIPVGSTKYRNTRLEAGFLILWKPEPCPALAGRRGRVVRQNRDGDFERLTTKDTKWTVFGPQL